MTIAMVQLRAHSRDAPPGRLGSAAPLLEASTSRDSVLLPCPPRDAHTQEDVYSGTVSEGLRDVTHKVASVAKAHLDEASALKPSVPEAARPLLLPSVACLSYLQALEKCEFDPYHPSLAKGGVSPLWHVLQIKWHLLYKSY